MYYLNSSELPPMPEPVSPTPDWFAVFLLIEFLYITLLAIMRKCNDEELVAKDIFLASVASSVAFACIYVGWGYVL